MRIILMFIVIVSTNSLSANKNDLKKFEELSLFFKKNNLLVYKGISFGMTKESFYALTKKNVKDKVKCATSLEGLCVLDIDEDKYLNIKQSSFIFYDNVLISFFFYVDNSTGKNRRKRFGNILKYIDTSKYLTQYKKKLHLAEYKIDKSNENFICNNSKSKYLFSGLIHHFKFGKLLINDYHEEDILDNKEKDYCDYSIIGTSYTLEFDKDYMDIFVHLIN